MLGKLTGQEEPSSVKRIAVKLAAMHDFLGFWMGSKANHRKPSSIHLCLLQ